MPRATGFNGGTVRIRVIEAEGLLAMDSGGFFSGKASSDPYVQGVVASVGRKDRPVFKTEVRASNSHQGISQGNSFGPGWTALLLDAPRCVIQFHTLQVMR